MYTDEVTDGASVFSSIFYAKKNPPLKQQILLDLSSKASSIQSLIQTDERSVSYSPQQSLSKQLSTNNALPVESNSEGSEIQKENLSRIKKATYKPQRLSNYYPEIPPVKEKSSSVVKPEKRGKKRKPSPTRQLLLSALKESKEKIPPLSEKDLTKKTRQPRKRRKIAERSRIIQLNHFVSEKVIQIAKSLVTKTKSRSNGLPEEVISEKTPKNAPQIQSGSSPDVTEPFPFTTITEWLIWHNNHPELAFVREAYDIDEVPDDEEVEVFWVNVMNEPEFFNTNWRIAGLSIDVETLKSQRGVERAPEWDILSTETDGFTVFFEDVYQILAQNPNGLRDYRFPILRFALKGLLLLDLAFYDEENQKWLNKGSVEDLSTRLKELDQFISQQEDIPSYQQALKTLFSKNEWYIGLICFDLIAIGSIFISQFSQNRVSEDEKIQVIIQEAFNHTVAKKLRAIEKYEQLKVKNLLKKLTAS